MTVIRLYRTLIWLSRWLSKLPFTDRWGENIGDDLDHWCLLRMFAYVDRVQQATGFSPVQVSEAPIVPLYTGNLSTATTTCTGTWP